MTNGRSRMSSVFLTKAEMSERRTELDETTVVWCKGQEEFGVISIELDDDRTRRRLSEMILIKFLDGCCYHCEVCAD